MISWFDPRLLALTGIQALLSSVFGAYADRRVTQTMPGASCHSLWDDQCTGTATNKTVWLDYVADLGDGFDPTFAVAWHLAQHGLSSSGNERLVKGATLSSRGDGARLERGDLLVMGGDQVYPAPSEKRYRNQTIEPYAAALPPGSVDGKPPILFAIPGNHDWYDGLTQFLEQFCSQRRVGNWRIIQEQSYFAVRLPHNWWLFGIDIQFTGRLDRAQAAYFERLAQGLTRDDRVMVCTAKPVWLEAMNGGSGAPDETAKLEHFIQKVTSKGARVPLVVAGDHHFYAHHVRHLSTGDRHYLTAGGGGAFQHPTHNVPNSETLERIDEPFPTREESKRQRRRLLSCFLPLNPSFFLVAAALQLVASWSIQFGLRRDQEGFAQAIIRTSDNEWWSDLGRLWSGFIRNPVALLLGIAVIGAWTIFAKGNWGTKKWWHKPVGALHGVVHLAAVFFVFLAAAQLSRPATRGWPIWLLTSAGAASSLGLMVAACVRLSNRVTAKRGIALLLAASGAASIAALAVAHGPSNGNYAEARTTILFVALVGGLGGFASCMIVGWYLFIVNHHPFGMHDNEAYSAMHLSGHKHFLRMKLTAEKLVVYPIGIVDVGRAWRPVPFWAEKSCSKPDKVEATLIEEPFDV